MRLLLDTHLLLRWVIDSRDLGKEARSLIADPYNAVFVSTVSLWEIWLKHSIGKLGVPPDFDERLTGESFEILPLSRSHARKVAELPWAHRDPFDRMLVTQAAHEKLLLLTADTQLGKYGKMVRVVD